MKNPRLILHIGNSMNFVFIMLYVGGYLRWYELPYNFKSLYFLGPIFLIVFIKNKAISKYNLKEPLTTIKVVKILRMTSTGLFIVGVLAKIMHWPGGSLIITISMMLHFAALILSFVLPDDETEKESNPEILDDI